MAETNRQNEALLRQLTSKRPRKDDYHVNEPPAKSLKENLVVKTKVSRSKPRSTKTVASSSGELMSVAGPSKPDGHGPVKIKCNTFKAPSRSPITVTGNCAHVQDNPITLHFCPTFFS